MIRKRRQKIHVVPHRRRREKKTDYHLRLKLLKARKPRFVVRKSLNNITCQIIDFDPKGDKVLATADSKELKKFGWDINCGNIPAAYLTGFLCGLRAKKKNIKNAILDIGLYTSTKGSRLYAALKGAVDSGLDIPHSEEILPEDERIKGIHIAEFAEKIKSESPGEYKKRFSGYLKKKIEPEKLPEIFEKVKNNILQKT